MKTKQKGKSSNRCLGWVVRDINADMYVNSNPNYGFTRQLKNAKLFGSRSIARKFREVGSETVDKVIVENNRAVSVIGGHWE
jgi:hypothetical protein